MISSSCYPNQKGSEQKVVQDKSNIFKDAMTLLKFNKILNWAFQVKQI